jgi:high-affinity nickel permease
MFYILLTIINIIILFILYYNYNKKLHSKIEQKTQEYIKKEQ